MKELIEKALKEIRDAIDNVDGRYNPNGDDWQTDDPSLIVSLNAAERILEEMREAARK